MFFSLTFSTFKPVELIGLFRAIRAYHMGNNAACITGGADDFDLMAFDVDFACIHKLFIHKLFIVSKLALILFAGFFFNVKLKVKHAQR